jgi:Tol biopolymer transport system component
MQVTSMGRPQRANARWLPDGRTILFNSRREGSADLYLLRPDTGELRRITDDATEELEPRNITPPPLSASPRCFEYHSRI